MTVALDHACHRESLGGEFGIGVIVQRQGRHSVMKPLLFVEVEDGRIVRAVPKCRDPDGFSTRHVFSEKIIKKTLCQFLIGSCRDLRQEVIEGPSGEPKHADEIVDAFVPLSNFMMQKGALETV